MESAPGLLKMLSMSPHPGYQTLIVSKESDTQGTILPVRGDFGLFLEGDWENDT